MQALSCVAKINNIEEREGKKILILDQTVFYPQGGGQPSDVGIIQSKSTLFKVDHVRYCDGLVEHIGEIVSGGCNVGDSVSCSVSENERLLHTRLHSAGHLVDLALQKMNIDWVPGKGFHFPVGSYVEYSGEIKLDSREAFIARLESVCNQIIMENRKVSVSFSKNKTQNGKALRTVHYGDFGIECGGTHVSELSEIG